MAWACYSTQHSLLFNSFTVSNRFTHSKNKSIMHIFTLFLSYGMMFWDNSCESCCHAKEVLGVAINDFCWKRFLQNLNILSFSSLYIFNCITFVFLIWKCFIKTNQHSYFTGKNQYCNIHITKILLCWFWSLALFLWIFQWEKFLKSGCIGYLVKQFPSIIEEWDFNIQFNLTLINQYKTWIYSSHTL